MSFAILSGCGSARSDYAPGLVSQGPVSYVPLKKIKPDAVRIVPFTKSPKLGSSAGQPVYALFSSTDLPSVAGALAIGFYGTLPQLGKAGPLAQVALETTGGGQHLYVDARGRLFEITDRASSTLMLLTYPSANETDTAVCRSGNEIGSIVEITRNGVTSTTVKRVHNACPTSIGSQESGDASTPVAAAAGDAVVPAPSLANVNFYSCMMASAVFTAASDQFAQAATLYGGLDGLGTTYAQLRSLFGGLCSDRSLIILEAAKTPPPCTANSAADQPACDYQAPPVELAPKRAICPSAAVILATFNAPGQQCTASIAYDVGSASVNYTVTTSNTAIASVSPTSGSLTGKGNLVLTITAGSVGGTATVTAEIPVNGVPQKSIFTVTNDWTVSTVAPIDAIRFQLPSNSLQLGKTLTFSVEGVSSSGLTIVGTYDRPIVLKGTNLTLSPATLKNSGQAAQVTATWDKGFTGKSGTITASADGHTTSVVVKLAGTN
jgi:hypothetical protein